MTTEQVDAASGDDGEEVCYLCLGGGADDEAGQQVRRDCSCRGTDAGFVHLSCLAEYAETISKQAKDDMDEFIKPWRVCPNCHQEYQNELAVDIATEFVPFVRRQYPDNTQRQVEALYVKQCALMGMLVRLQPVQKREAGVTANDLLSMIDRMKNDTPLSKRYSFFEANAYHVHGRIALIEGTKESARRAVTHFEKCLEVSESIGDDEGIIIAKQNIAIAKSKYEGGMNSEEFLKASEELYKVRVAELGEESERTIHAGRNYAICLQKANRCDEARELLIKLLATSRQVLGPHHSTTKSVESMLKRINFITLIRSIENARSSG